MLTQVKPCYFCAIERKALKTVFMLARNNRYFAWLCEGDDGADMSGNSLKIKKLKGLTLVDQIMFWLRKTSIKMPSWCHDDAKHSEWSIEQIQEISCAAERGHNFSKSIVAVVFIQRARWLNDAWPCVNCGHLWFPSLIENTTSFSFHFVTMCFEVPNSAVSFMQ